MIPFVDVGLGAFLREKFPEKFSLAFAPLELSDQGLAKSTGQERRGVPGITFWRSKVDSTKMPNLPKAAAPGLYQGKDGSNARFTRQADRVVEYTVRCVTQHLSDRDLAERIFAFMGIYETVAVEIKDAGNNTFAYDFPIWTEPVNYEYKFKPDTGEVLWHGFTTKITTEAWWAIGHETPLIEEIFVNYREFASGNPLTDPLLESITITNTEDGIEIVGEDA